MLLISEAIADRAGRPRDDFAVRTLAGAIIGSMFAVLSELADDPDAELAVLVDRAFSFLEGGLRL
ncbi:hypothetical protein ABH923_001898 [Leifsonia sp. EB41]|uniref:acyl-CoA-like ligand-binding transcription factor n=1 Tax=Leifsonia sp. EB41 TaxID=3156260 RepID=UPI003510F75C